MGIEDECTTPKPLMKAAFSWVGDILQYVSPDMRQMR